MALHLKVINEGLFGSLKDHCELLAKLLQGAIQTNRTAALNRS
jgi:hypothetical protein